MHLAQELLMSTLSIQWWFKKFCKGDESFEDEECSGQPLEVDNDQLRGSPKLILLQLHEKLPKNSVLTITIVQHLKQIGKVKKFYKGMPHELTEKKKKVLNSIQQQQTISQSNCDMQWKVDFMWQPAMTSSVVIESQRWSSKTLSKAKLAPRKSHGHCLGVCCWSDPQQLSESQWNHYIWEVCSANQWDALKTPMPVACTGQQNGPVLHDNAQPLIAQPTLPKLNELGYEVLSYPPYSPDLSPTDYHLQASQQLFAGKMLPQPAGGRKCFPRVHWILKHKFLQYRNKKKLISLWQKCVDCNGSYFD